jgi:hypothetical protein
MRSEADIARRHSRLSIYEYTPSRPLKGLRNIVPISGAGGTEGLRPRSAIECTACTRACPLCRYARIILRARSAAIARIFSLTFLRNVVAYVCRAPPGQDRYHARSPR